MNNLELNKLIYVVGSPRSGSTLIYNSLCSSKIFNPGLPENHLVPNLVGYFLKQLERNKKEKNIFFDSNDDTLNYFKKCIEIHLQKISTKYQTDKLLLKSIVFGSNIYLMNILFPKEKFIMTIRDPRDIICSMLDISEKQIAQGQLPQYPRNMSTLCNFINEKYNILSNSKYSYFTKESVIIIKYEDFIDDHQSKLNDTMKKLGIDFSFSKNHNYWDFALNLNSTSDNLYDSTLWNKPISNSKIGVYKNLLTLEEINDVNKNCESLISRFNY